MRFEEVTLSHRPAITSVVAESGELGCEYCFGNFFMWAWVYNTRIHLGDHFFVTKEERPFPRYLCPTGNLGESEFQALIPALIADARKSGHPFAMHRVRKDCIARIRELYPDRFAFAPERDDFDYLYSRDDLAFLRGKKYHSKRNFITRFEAGNPGWSYEEITPENIPDCVGICRKWLLTQDGNSGAQTEFKALSLGFDHYEKLGFKGGLLRVGGVPVAFTFGEPITDKCFVTHAEKALREYTGAYAMINREFAKNSLSEYELINREDDMGIEGLRAAKLSYHPVMLYEKYIMTPKSGADGFKL